MLPDGVARAEFGGLDVRKGTVAAFLANARIRSDPATSEADRAAVGRDIVALLPALRAVGLFDVLTISDAELAAFVADRG